ncbi:MAG: DUF6062 family protein [Firmicutes bacterium]|nr:DUF6062 family protein [Bacillota bacterium]
MAGLDSIETLPILEAFEASKECPICTLQERDEQWTVESYLRESVMDPRARSELEAAGICRRHADMLLVSRDMLGTAITLGSILRAWVDGQRLMEREGAGEKGDDGRAGIASVLRSRSRAGRLRGGARSEGSCWFCRSMRAQVERRVTTLLDLYSRSPEFRGILAGSSGLCIPHARLISRWARALLRQEEQAEIMESLERVVTRRAKDLMAKLDWFITKHDYRYADHPWNDSEDGPGEVARFLLGRSGMAELEVH